MNNAPEFITTATTRQALHICNSQSNTGLLMCSSAYQARATTAGTFKVLPLQLYAMYDPEVIGRTGGMEVTVK